MNRDHILYRIKSTFKKIPKCNIPLRMRDVFIDVTHTKKIKFKRI